MEMDPCLWSCLSPELIDFVLTKLPFLDLMMLRPVCKEWNSKILTWGGIQATNHAPKRVLVRFHFNGPFSKEHSLSIYCDIVGRRAEYRVSLGFHQENVIPLTVHLAASGGGLLVFSMFCSVQRSGTSGEDYEPFLQSFLVYNPLTGAYELVKVSDLSARFCISVLRSHDSYQLILVCNLGDGGQQPRIYHSSTRSWRNGKLCAEAVGELTTTVVCTDCLYLLLSGSAVWKYHLLTDSWNLIPIPRDGTSSIGIVCQECRLILFTCSLHLGTLYIYDLQEVVNNEGLQHHWRRKSEMPENVLHAVRTLLGTGPELTPRRWHTWQVLGDGDSIYVIAYRSNGNNPPPRLVVLEHDLSNDTWRWLEAFSGLLLKPEDFRILRPSLQSL